MIIYIAGPITGHLDYKEKFARAERRLKEMGHIVLNPAWLPDGLGGLEDYLNICIPMVDRAQGIYLLDGWQDSKGSLKELRRAQEHSKKIFYETLINESEAQL